MPRKRNDKTFHPENCLLLYLLSSLLQRITCLSPLRVILIV